MEIAHIIASLRTANHMSQRELASALNVSAGVIGSWETGVSRPGFENCIALADYFKISTDVLFEKDRTLAPEDYKPLQMPQDLKKIVAIFTDLNEDNRDILIGRGREMLKEQRLEEKSVVPEKEKKAAQ